MDGVFGTHTHGSLARVDTDSLNHRLHRNINSARGYERLIDLVVERSAQ